MNAVVSKCRPLIGGEVIRDLESREDAAGQKEQRAQSVDGRRTVDFHLESQSFVVKSNAERTRTASTADRTCISGRKCSVLSHAREFAHTYPAF